MWVTLLRWVCPFHQTTIATLSDELGEAVATTHSNKRVHMDSTANGHVKS